MASKVKAKVLCIGGTGAQGRPVVQELIKDGKYSVIILSRDAKSPEAVALTSANPEVSIFIGSIFDEQVLHEAFLGIDACFINTNGFPIGEAKEVFWGIRIFEIAHEMGVKHFVYSSLDYASKLGGYDPKYRCGHLDGKGKVSEYIMNQPTSPMAWSIISSGPYLEGLEGTWGPYKDSDGTVVFDYPLGDGALPLISLVDFGRYVRWQFDTPEKSVGNMLKVSTEHVSGEYLAKTFTEVTGKKAVYKNVSLEHYFKSTFPRLTGVMDAKNTLVGGGQADESTLQSYEQNFSGFWNHWAASGDNKSHGTRDYERMNSILPDRLKSIGEWMRQTGYQGDMGPLILKEYADRYHK